MSKKMLVSPTTPSQLRRLRQHFFVFLLAIIIPVLGIILFYKQHSEDALQARILDEVAAHTKQQQLAFEQVIQIATSHVLRVGAQFVDAIEKPELGPNAETWQSLRHFGVRNRGSGELIGSELDAWWRERLGALFVSPSALENPSLDKEISAAMSIFPAIRATHHTYPFFQWTYFYSPREDFTALYPYVSSTELQLATGSKSIEAMLKVIFDAGGTKPVQMIGPESNPERQQRWTAPYEDAGGKGAMVSLLSPQYLNDEFIGVLGTDVTLSMFGNVLQNSAGKLGHALVVDQFGNLIADDAGVVQRNKNILHQDKVLPKAFSQQLAAKLKVGSADPLNANAVLKKNALHRVGDWYLVKLPLAGSGWDLLVFFPAAELRSLVKQETGNTFWIMLGLFGVLGIATWLMSYYFALPALKLVDFLIQLTTNPGQHSPLVPRAWRPSFALVETTSRERHGYLQELEVQAGNLEKEVLLRTKEAVAQTELAEKARHDIALLSEMGREITASLDLVSIEQALYKHVQRLTLGDTFGIGLVDWDKRIILFDFVMENNLPMQPYQRSLDAIEQPSTQCALGAVELLIDELAVDTSTLDQFSHKGVIERQILRKDGSAAVVPRSALYVPVMLHQKVIGVICIQSVQANFFHKNDLDILRTLGAYAGVALDNAMAYQRLQQTQAKLVEQEKLAALGALVAGVAHELNTPLGNSLLTATSLAEMTKEMVVDMQQGKLRRSSFDEYGKRTESACTLIVANLSKAADLIAGFKQIAVDQTSNQRRQFNLSTVSEEVALTLFERLRREEHQVEIHIPDEIELDSFPGAYGQVISNLIINASLHGFANRRGGSIKIKVVDFDNSQVKLSVADDGCGISKVHLARIFEPFFTTRMGQGGSGLGLHISYNIVTGILGGSIQVQSAVGQGTIFEITLPLCAPVKN